MILLTDELRAQLLANGRDHGADHVPVVKLFNPLGEGVWLATELDVGGSSTSGVVMPDRDALSCQSIQNFV